MNALIQWNISTYMVATYVNSTFMNIPILAYVSPMFVIHHNYMNYGCLYSCSFKHIASVLQFVQCILVIAFKAQLD